MKDCSSCKDNVFSNPEYVNMEFKETPCASCRVKEPSRQNMVSYGPQFENPSHQTWEIIKNTEQERSLETFQYWLSAWSQLEQCDQQIIQLIAQNPGSSQAELARVTGVSRQAIHKKIRRLRKRFPGVFA